MKCCMVCTNLMIRELNVTNLAIFNWHSMSLEKNANSMDIAFLALLDQLLEVGQIITALEKVDINNRPLLSATSS